MKYVAVFASSASLADFRLPEFQFVAATLRVPITFLDDKIPWVAGGADTFWFSVFESPASRSELKALAERCALLRGVYTLFETAPTLEDLYACLEGRHGTAPGSAAPSLASSPTTAATAFVGEDETTHLASSTYSYQVETIGKKYSADAKRAVAEAVLKRVPRAGEVEWRQPGRAYYIFLQHAIENAPPGAQGWVSNAPLLRVFHCCLCVESSRSALLATYDLRKRPYIGTTSMPPEESLMMANMSGVCRGHYVYDPFCGTGSLLIAAAHYGARTFGSDADGRAMRAGTEKGKTSPQMQQQRRLALAAYPEEQLCVLTEEERVLPSMITNFKLYHLPPPDRARMNFSAWPRTWHTCALRLGSGGIFDSIITDPPYGLREPRKKVETTTPTIPTAAAASTEAGRDNAVKQQAVTFSAYPTHEVLLDLVMFAATYLVVGGHLTFWHPTTDHYTDDELPTHPSLRIVCNIAQRVSLKVVRRLIVLRKVAPVPTPPPSRESCAAKKSPDDLRVLMDETELPDNADYMHYRAKRERKREAAHKYKSSAGASSSPSTPVTGEDVRSGSDGGNRRGRKHSRLDGQDKIVANRQRNIELRAAKQAASHLTNAAHKTVDQTRP
ncbi:methyltransferase-like protein [Leishmania mexicana MHOM/GT/2001/U1103]|uniref:Methyltransferase-like protein n=1 Tax=Leishmania mexicana (strain MHOM/GT/2001/U1103) TaxID=929439 RepID=E9AKK7_LEIMU|nr:methyltransferase-like protein [Leishmania mexicana MHOM/GT/2001/U1103]CBZ23458.1 methyltransferase-like protein [Leishmania mexicana MHOM/GT/2001/U1103]